MIFGENRAELRQAYCDAWQKCIAGRPLSPLEAQLAAVVEEHPEYQEAVLSEDKETDFPVEEGKINPFLHMGLHLSIRDQVKMDRPAGIKAVFDKLSAKIGSAHHAEHRMFDALAETLWEAQQRRSPPDETAYVQRLRRLY